MMNRIHMSRHTPSQTQTLPPSVFKPIRFKICWFCCVVCCFWCWVSFLSWFTISCDNYLFSFNITNKNRLLQVRSKRFLFYNNSFYRSKKYVISLNGESDVTISIRPKKKKPFPKESKEAYFNRIDKAIDNLENNKNSIVFTTTEFQELAQSKL